MGTQQEQIPSFNICDEQAALGADRVEEAKAVMGSEALDGKIPGVMFWLGAAHPGELAESRKTGVALLSPTRPSSPPSTPRGQNRPHRDDRHMPSTF